jgi:hypothetical protein
LALFAARLDANGGGLRALENRVMIRLTGDWIPLQRETWLKPEIMRIGRMSGIPRFHALGIMAAFWSWASGVTVDGHVDATVDDLVDMFETPPNFWECVQSVGWIEIKGDHVKIPRADSWLTNAAKARITKNQRQKRWREGKAAGDSVDGHVDAKAPTRREEIREENTSSYLPSSENALTIAKPMPAHRRQEEGDRQSNPIIERMKLSGPVAAKLAALPVTDAIALWLEVKGDASIKSPAGILNHRIDNGHPVPRFTSGTIIEAVKAGIIHGVNGINLRREKLTYSHDGLLVGSNLEEKRLILPTADIAKARYE